MKTKQYAQLINIFTYYIKKNVAVRIIALSFYSKWEKWQKNENVFIQSKVVPKEKCAWIKS